MAIFSAEFDGVLRLDNVPENFTKRIEKRVSAGLLTPSTHSRANYSITSINRDSVSFAANSLLAAINIGLNEVTLRRLDGCSIAYNVRYDRWARYCLWLCLAIVLLVGVPQIAVLAMQPDATVRTWGLPFGVAAALFFGIGWPWVLTVMHRGPARRCLERILHEVCGDLEGAFPAPYLGKRYTSEARLFGMPLVSIAVGPGPGGSARGVAMGFLALGDIAFGVIAIGGVACGCITFGGASIGLLAAAGGAAIGGVALGGFALGGIALGGLAIGGLAIGGMAIGLQPQGGQTVVLGALARLLRLA